LHTVESGQSASELQRHVPKKHDRPRGLAVQSVSVTHSTQRLTRDVQLLGAQPTPRSLAVQSSAERHSTQSPVAVSQAGVAG
jgi:hypothetical protein